MSITQPIPTAHPTSSVDIVDWRPEDPAFWESKGKKIAYRNLAISVPALLCGFAVWGMWGIITVQMLNLGFPFSQAELFTLTAIAGLAGATMRIPASFLIRLAGGRNTIFLTTAMLLAPAIGTGIVLQHKDWPLVGIPADGALVWCRRRQLRQLDVEHQHVLSEAAARHGFGYQRRSGQLRRHQHADRDSAGDDGGLVRGVRWRADDAVERQRLDLRQDRGRHANLDSERWFCMGAVAGAAVDPVLVRHEQPADCFAEYRRHDRRVPEDHVALHAVVRAGDPRDVSVPAGADRARGAEHVGGDRADHRQHAAGAETRRLSAR